MIVTYEENHGDFEEPIFEIAAIHESFSYNMDPFDACLTLYFEAQYTSWDQPQRSMHSTRYEQPICDMSRRPFHNKLELVSPNPHKAPPESVRRLFALLHHAVCLRQDFEP